MPRYPYKFIQADAIEYVKQFGHLYDVVHASPPCQASSALTKGTNKGLKYLDLIPDTREALATLDVPTIIENVQGSDLRRDITLCGEYFGLKVIRHRYFELNGFSVPQPEHIKHRGRVIGWRHGKRYDGYYYAVYGEGGGKGTVEEWQDAMGIDWTETRKEIAEAIPPLYTQYIGKYLMEHLNDIDPQE